MLGLDYEEYSARLALFFKITPLEGETLAVDGKVLRGSYLLSEDNVWAVKTGEWLHQLNPIKVKKYGRQAKSIFRYGFDRLRSIVTDLDLKQDEFLFFLQFLSCT